MLCVFRVCASSICIRDCNKLRGKLSWQLWRLGGTRGYLPPGEVLVGKHCPGVWTVNELGCVG